MQSPTRIYQKSVSFHFLHFLRGIIWILFHFIIFQSATINKYMHVLVKLKTFWSFLNMIFFQYLNTFYIWIQVFIILFQKHLHINDFWRCAKCVSHSNEKRITLQKIDRERELQEVLILFVWKCINVPYVLVHLKLHIRT